MTDLYLDGQLDKSMLDTKNAALLQRKYELENEIEKRKAVDQSNSITEKDIELYITELIEKIKKHNSPNESEFMQSVFSAFVEKVIVTGDSITVFVNTDFSVLCAGDSRKFAGAIRHLSPVKFAAFLPRKQQLFGRMEYINQFIISHRQ